MDFVYDASLVSFLFAQARGVAWTRWETKSASWAAVPWVQCSMSSRMIPVSDGETKKYYCGRVDQQLQRGCRVHGGKRNRLRNTTVAKKI